MGVHRAVELALGVVDPAHQRPHPPGAVQGHQGGLLHAGLGLTLDNRPRSGRGDGVQRQVEGRLDHQILLRLAD